MAKSEAAPSLKTEFGYESSFRLKDGTSEINRPFLQQKLTLPIQEDSEKRPAWTPESISLSYRAWSNFSYLSAPSSRKSEVALRGLDLFWRGETWTLRAGLQEMTWGETFGVRVVDVINPRDYSEFLLTDLEWARVPVWSIVGQKFIGPVSLQLVYTPVSATDILPNQIGPWQVIAAPSPEAFKDSEYGGKVGLLLPNGTDLNLHYYRHWNRIPVYRATQTATGAPALEALRPSYVNGFGTSFTHALDHLVLRGDIAYDRDTWLTSTGFGAPQKVHPLHGILGADWTFDDQSTWGTQYHMNSNPIGNHPLIWMSTQVRVRFFNGNLVPEAMFFKGINNADTWLSPRLGWTFLERWKLHLQSDFLWGRPGGFFSLYEKENRFLSRLTYEF